MVTPPTLEDVWGGVVTPPTPEGVWGGGGGDPPYPEITGAAFACSLNWVGLKIGSPGPPKFDG